MQGPPCAHHRQKSHTGAKFSHPLTPLQITLHNPSLSAMLSFRDQNTNQHAVLLISLPLLKLLGDQRRRGQITQVATSKRTSPLIPLSSHLVCNQDRMGEGREVVLNFTPSRQCQGRKVLLSAAQKLVFTHDDQRCLGFQYQSKCHNYIPDDTAVQPHYFQVLDTQFSYFSSVRHAELLLLPCILYFQ